MKLEQLRQFVELERYGSVSKAAKALYIGRTTLSDSLAAFEKEVGVRLLERTAAGVTLTKEGREVLQVAKQVLEMTDKILQVGNQEQRICGKITVVLGQVFNFLGSDIIVQFHQRFPDAELELLVKTHTELLQDVFVRGNIGLTIFPKKEMELYNRKIEQQKLHADIFGEYHFDVFVSAQSQYARKNSITAEELYANQIAANSSDF